MKPEINQSWDEFMTSLSKEDNEGIAAQIKCPLLNLFDKQINVDKARKMMFKPELNQLIKLYLSRIEIDELNAKMNAYRNNFVRGMGLDKFNHLKLLVKLKIMMDEKKPKKGLLAV